MLTTPVIIIFYPTLPIHEPDPSPSKESKDGALKKAVKAVVPHQPKTTPPPTYAPTACEYHNKKYLRFRSIPNTIPTPEQLDKILGDEDHDLDLINWESKKQKQEFASVYNMNLKLHLKDHFRKHRARMNNHNKKGEDSERICSFIFSLCR